MNTLMVNNKDVKIAWHLFDAKTEVLGRLSTKAAILLMGKNKVNYTPHIDQGDGVIIINAEKIKITGNKLVQKNYKKFSGYPGGLSLEPMEHLLKRKPTDILRHSIKGMLPKNRLGRLMIRRLKIYAGDKHPHEAQLAVKKEKKEKKKESK